MQTTSEQLQQAIKNEASASATILAHQGMIESDEEDKEDSDAEFKFLSYGASLSKINRIVLTVTMYPHSCQTMAADL